MSDAAVLRREAALSAAINGVLSLLFFVLVFGLRAPAPLPALGRDCLPQAFMVTLMGSLVPALLMRRRLGGRVVPIVRRALLFAMAVTALVGGSAYMLGARRPGAVLAPLPAVTLKILFGATLGAVMTPLALRPLLRAGGHA